MNLNKIGKFIAKKRKALEITQEQLAKALNITDKAVSKWERGLSFPDVSVLSSLASVLKCNITEILSGEPKNEHSSVKTHYYFVDEEYDNDLSVDLNVNFNTDSEHYVSHLLFGNNLEHTRSSVFSGISAQMIKNRKFAGKPTCRKGCAHQWFAIGEKAYFSFEDPYTRHADGYHMNRVLECNSQRISAFTDEIAGLGQQGLFLDENMVYDFSVVLKSTRDVVLKIAFSDDNGHEICSDFISVTKGDEFEEKAIQLKSTQNCKNASVTITFEKSCTITIGAISLMPADNFRGMRKDVISAMQELGITILRWPGGNFAGEYNWKDGLLPSNMRAPFQSCLWIETQPNSMGFDFHEINTDDFVALCRKIGAEPFITINPSWNTPEESAQWVEYCNGDETTEYGKLRIQRGFKEPYNVTFWSLGNEFGYGHMEGANESYEYANVVRRHATAMLEKCDTLTLCSSGPYPNDDWAVHSANALSDVAPLVAMHYYPHYPKFDNPDNYKEQYEVFLGNVNEFLARTKQMRKTLNNDALRISLDEWSSWFAWYRPESVCDGIYTALMMHILIKEEENFGIALACHFEAVNEGALYIKDNRVFITPMGQAISLMSQHANGKLLYSNKNAVATEKNGVTTITLINSLYDEDAQTNIPVTGEIITSKLYTSDSILPYTVFDIKNLDYSITGETITAKIPPHSIAIIQYQAK